MQGTLGVRTITVNASQHVPMLFMRVLGISQSTVAATAQVTVRFVNMMLVVDRSGSVFRATYNGTPTTQIVNDDLHQFVDPSDGSQSPYFSDGRDNIGMVSFGASWNLDFPLSLNFQSGTPHIGTAIDAIDWNTNNSTNTAEGLFHGFRELEKLAQPGALNVIVMLTDGRPSSFSGSFTCCRRQFLHEQDEQGRIDWRPRESRLDTPNNRYHDGSGKKPVQLRRV